MIHLVVDEEAYVVNLCGYLHIERLALLFSGLGVFGFPEVGDGLANPLLEWALENITMNKAVDVMEFQLSYSKS